MANFPIRNRALPLILVIVVALLGPQPLRAADGLYEQTVRGTGWVLIPKGQGTFMCGTCCLVDADRRLAVTNSHVVGKARALGVYVPVHLQGRLITDAGYYLRGLTPVPAEVLATDGKRDLALIRLDWVPEGMRALALAPRSARPGQVVHSVGNSGLAGKPLEAGTLWGRRGAKVLRVAFEVMQPENGKGQVEAHTVRTDAMTSSGDSGGPLVDEHGRLVGLVDGYDADRKCGLSIDVREIRAFLTRALEPAASSLLSLSSGS
jgi:hypothetical protein